MRRGRPARARASSPPARRRTTGARNTSGRSPSPSCTPCAAARAAGSTAGCTWPGTWPASRSRPTGASTPPGTGARGVAAGRSYPVAVIPGDGIGPELVSAALAVADAAGAEFGFALDVTEVAAGAGAYQRDGTALSPAALEVVRQARATLKGPVGLP